MNINNYNNKEPQCYFIEIDKMLKIVILSAVLTISFSFLGCTQRSMFVLQPEISKYENKEIFYQDDVEIPVSTRENSVVMVIGEQIGRNMVKIHIAYYNIGHDNITIEPSLITAYSINPSNLQYEPLHVYSTEETVDLLKKEYNRNVALSIFASGLSNVGTTTSKTNTKIRGFTSGGDIIYGSLTSSTRTTDHSQKSKELSENFSSLRGLYKMKKKDLLKRNTLPPGSYKLGYRVFQYDTYTMRRVMIKIPIEQDIHQFWFKPTYNN